MVGREEDTIDEKKEGGRELRLQRKATGLDVGGEITGSVIMNSIKK